jgi:hypothetical protein
MSALDDLLAPTGKSLKFETPGQTYTGIVISTAVRQATEFGTGKPLTFDDGSPREQIVIILDTQLRDDVDDDGTRSLYIKGWGPQKRAFIAAVKANGSPEAGDTLTVTFTGFGDRPVGGGFAAKLYEYRIEKATVTVPVDESDAPPWETTQAQPATSSTPTGEAREKALKLIATGMFDDVEIGAATGLAPLLIKRLREGN